MKKHFLFTILSVFSVYNCLSQIVNWSVSGNFPSSLQICKDVSDNLYTSGFWGNQFPNYASQVKKYDPNGLVVWTKNLGLTDIRIHVTNSNIVWFTGVDPS